MVPRTSIVLLISGLFIGLASTAPADPPAQFDLAKHVQLPPGFVIEKIAGPPLVKHPLHVTFDDKDRCYVTEMAGVNRNRQELEKELPNGIRRLTSSKNDGVYDQATQFADKMTFPAGILWHQGAIYTTSFPYLWKLIDKDDDGIADERIPLVGKFGSVGNAADLHGPQLGPDGWLYFCNGRNGHSVTLGDGTKLEGRASGLYRCKTDGSGLERVFAGGMDNPVEVAFTPAGEPLVCTNLILNSPRHDGILFGLEGAVYPYDVRAVKELKWTGQYLPIMGELGWVAVSSIVRLDALFSKWGDNYKDKYYTAEFNTHSVRSHTITRNGASFTLKSEPFLTCTHPDFHPTQILQGPDGNMILVDTGGWFRNGCPTSQISKPNVEGGIYRIKRKREPQSGNPVQIDTITTIHKPEEQLSNFWADARSLSEKVDPKKMADFRRYLNHRLDIQLTALRFIGQYRDTEAAEAVIKLLEHEHPAIRREAAQTLGRLKSADAVVPLVKALETADDPFLEHALIYALTRIQQPGSTSAGLGHTSARVQRGVLIALDQMGDNALSWDAVAPMLQTSDARLKEAALDVVARRPQWVTDLADYVDRELNKKNLDDSRLTGLKNLIIALAPQGRMQQLIADRLACEDTTGNVRYIILEAMAQADLSKWPQLWNGPLKSFLGEKKYDHDLIMQAVLAAGAGSKGVFDKELMAIAETADRPMAVRLAAAGIALQEGKPVSDSFVGHLLHALRPDEEPAIRLAAAKAISVAHFNPAQLTALTKPIKLAGPLELSLLLGPWEFSSDGADYAVLVQALDTAPGLAAVPLDRLQKLVKKFPSELRSRAEMLLKKGRPDLAAQQARLEQLRPLLTSGDIKKGRELFFGPKAVCSTCHRIGTEGGLIGPNLSIIGAIRTRADLLESVVFPSASLARGFETMVIVTKSGRTITGVMTRETADALVLTSSQRVDQKVLRNDIEEMTASPVSTMPAGIDQTLNPDELRDLLAYLESLKK
ncbi:MAG TPA: HEAT repeat domain-containing protein [Gemmatales bacterium]|nr:HEAT repeat domain-containing protein [Gemmatales bacterium]